MKINIQNNMRPRQELSDEIRKNLEKDSLGEAFMNVIEILLDTRDLLAKMSSHQGVAKWGSKLK